jgi:uncharacterized protein YpmB
MKIFLVFGFILIAVILTFSIVFTQGMYQAASTESNSTQEFENQTVTKYETDYSWTFFIAFLAVVFVIIIVFGLFLT